jgi:hypothetical protein
VDGTPPLKDQAQAKRWGQICTAEYRKLIRASEQGQATLLDHYGATDEAEFFAVASECFFLQPKEMKSRHPRLYELFQEYYQQNPAERWTPLR